MKFIVHTDGGARGNPGPAAVGVVVEIYESTNDKSTNKTQQKKTVVEFGKRIGEATNNVAEYTAVREGLRTIQQFNNLTSLAGGQAINKENIQDIEIRFYLDSTLVVNQLNGLFKVKDAKLRELLSQIRILEQEVGLPAGKAGGVVTYTYVPREQNRRADFFVNKALDSV